ncbi:MAG TPA: type II toxin-antitoxin system RelE/ParE family toxin [Burkholderiales bacterium]|jgi:toxin ParE1/3/4|nr:type II toxin-antitoxin system RelE/ParE family toxin [Burkholderiales bacterium]
MRHEVILTRDAESDLEGILDYIAEHDVPGKDDYVLAQMDDVIESLSAFPERGFHPKELLALGIRDYRQTFFKPYRVIYHIAGRAVYVLMIVDGRRNMQALLARRLLAGK